MAKDSNSCDNEEIINIAIQDDEMMKMKLISHVSRNDTWIIDSGYSHHMTGDKTKFEHFEDYDGGSVRLGNNEPCCIKGKG